MRQNLSNNLDVLKDDHQSTYCLLTCYINRAYSLYSRWLDDETDWRLCGIAHTPHTIR